MASPTAKDEDALLRTLVQQTAAVERFRALVEREPIDGDAGAADWKEQLFTAEEERVNTLLELGRADEALTAQDQLAEELRVEVEAGGAGDFRPRLLAARGVRARLCHALGLVAEALEELEGVIEGLMPLRHAGSPEVFVTLLLALRDRGRILCETDQAERGLVDQGLVLDGFHKLVSRGHLDRLSFLIDARRARARTLESLGRFEAALEDRLLLAGLLYSIDHLEGALEEETAIVECRRRQVEAGRLDLAAELSRGQASRGVTLYRLGRGEEALADYDAAITGLGQLVERGQVELRSELLQVRANRAVLVGAMGRHEEALADQSRVLEELVSLTADNARTDLLFDLAVARGNRANTLFDLARFAEAAGEYAQVAAAYEALRRSGDARAQPARVRAARFRHGQALFQGGRYEEAVAELTDVMEADRQAAREQTDEQAPVLELLSAQDLRARSLAALGRGTAALVDHEAVLEAAEALVGTRRELVPSLLLARENYARTLTDLGRLRAALEQRTHVVEGYRQLLAHAERVPEGVRFFRGRLAEALRRRAGTLAGLGHLDESSADVDEADRLDPPAGDEAS